MDTKLRQEGAELGMGHIHRVIVIFTVGAFTVIGRILGCTNPGGLHVHPKPPVGQYQNQETYSLTTDRI